MPRDESYANAAAVPSEATFISAFLSVDRMNAAISRVRSAVGERWDPTALELGSVFVALTAVSLWSGLVASAAQAVVGVLAGPPSSLLFVSAATSALGLCGGSVAYARYRGFDLGLSTPASGTAAGAAAIVAAPVLLVAAASAVGNALFGVPLSAVMQYGVSPDVSLGRLALLVVPPAAFVGVGYGTVVSAVVVESVRGRVASGDAVAVATLVVGFFWLLPLRPVSRLPTGFGAAYELLVTLVFGVAFGAALGVLYRRRRSSAGSRLSRREAALVVVAAVGLVAAATGLTSAAEVVENLLWVVAFGLAAVGYHRTRSVWVAALALSGFSVALRLVAYVEATVGVATF